MKNTIAIVQARMNSTRFPGKSLAHLVGMPLLEMLLRRLLRARNLEAVVVATSDKRHDDPIEHLCESLELQCVRGDELDVVHRFAQALEQHPAEAVVRICADNPLTDPVVIDDLVESFHQAEVDYAFNNLPECGYPDGVAGEILSAEALSRVAEEAHEESDREHVTLFIKRNRQRFRVKPVQAPVHLWQPDLCLDVDHPEDLTFLTEFCSALPRDNRPNWSTEEIIATAQLHPEIVQTRRKRGA